MRKTVAFVIAFALSFLLCIPALGDTDVSTVTSPDLQLDAESAVLMEAKTGKVLYAQNEAEALPPASVTKIMTLLLTMEAIDRGKIKTDDSVTISEYASSMGGSQVFLAAGEQFTVKELIKCTVIASANDAAVALAEYIYGSETAFVEAMNARAAELSMTSTHFENVTGLDDTVQNHVTSAQDIAHMSRMLISHPMILEYSRIWMDSIRDGAFTLTNTNRLVRFYPGANGLKTGSTAKAKFCISATAERDGMTLIAVIMASPTRDVRNAETMRLLDWGFANYSLFCDSAAELGKVRVTCGIRDETVLSHDNFYAVVAKGRAKEVRRAVNAPELICAPAEKGNEVGSISYSLDGEIIGVIPVKVSDTVERITFGELFVKMLKTFLHPV